MYNVTARYNLRLSERYKQQRNGFTIFILFMVICVVSITAFSISQLVRQVATSSTRHSERIISRELAESGISRALFDIREILSQELVTPERPTPTQPQKVNENLLELMDIERAREWQRSYSFEASDLAEGGTITIHMELLNVTATPFTTFLSPLDKIPAYLEPYHLSRNMPAEKQLAKSPLGGWKGKLRIVATGKYRRSTSRIEQWNYIHMTDITAPASDYTLFISGEEREYLKKGQFVLSNLTVPEPVRNEILSLASTVSKTLELDEDESNEDASSASNESKASLQSVHKLNKDMSKIMSDSDPTEALKLAHTLTKSASDLSVKSTLDRIVLSLDPRDWGKVRTNGALFVELPFFATDDIINYFVDASPTSRRRPEIGFLGCENRLHDPYLSIYTLFEGRIYKSFRRLKPLSLGPSTKPQKVPPQRYTINTKMNYPRIRPQEKKPDRLERLMKKAASYAQIKSDFEMKLQGTPDSPIVVNGITLCTQKVSIGGTYTGSGIIVSSSNIHILSNLVPLNKGKDKLSLVATNGIIALNPAFNSFNVDAALYAKLGLKGSLNQSIKLNGNLVVEKLNREKMPKYFNCTYNSDMKNHMGDNVVGSLSRKVILVKN